MCRIRTSGRMLVEHMYDATIVGLVGAGDAAAWQELAPETSQNAHGVPLDPARCARV